MENGKKLRPKIDIREYSIIIFFVIMFVTFSVIAPGFSSFENIVNVLRQVSVTGIIAVGATMVLLTGGIDLSCGSLMACSGIIAASAMAQLGLHPVVACILGIISGALLGFLNAILVTKFDIPPLITTLGTMTGARGIVYIITKGVPIFGFPQGFKIIGGGHIGIVPIPVIIMLTSFGFGYLVLQKLPIGRYIYMD